MIIKQLSAAIENKAGFVWKVFQTLGDHDVNVLSYSIADQNDKAGVLRLIVDNLNRAEAALKEIGITTHTDDVYALAIPNVTGSMAEVLRRIADNEVSIHYMYALQYTGGLSQAIIHADDMERLRKVLTEYELETKFQ